MIKFRDFVPPQEKLGLLGEPGLTTVQSAVDAANHWIEAFGIDVFNVETLLLPNLSRDEDTIEAEIESVQTENGGHYWYQVVRVWFREDNRVDASEEIRIFDDED